MKITKQALRQMIRETVTTVQESRRGWANDPYDQIEYCITRLNDVSGWDIDDHVKAEVVFCSQALEDALERLSHERYADEFLE